MGGADPDAGEARDQPVRRALTPGDGFPALRRKAYLRASVSSKRYYPFFDPPEAKLKRSGRALRRDNQLRSLNISGRLIIPVARLASGTTLGSF